MSDVLKDIFLKLFKEKKNIKVSIELKQNWQLKRFNNCYNIWLIKTSLHLKRSEFRNTKTNTAFSISIELNLK